MSEEFCSKIYNSYYEETLGCHSKEETCACVRLFKTLFCEKTWQNRKKKSATFHSLTRYPIQTSTTLPIHRTQTSLPNTPQHEGSTHQVQKAENHTRLPLVLPLMNATHRNHAAHLSEWPSLPAQLISGGLPHAHCQLKCPVRTQTGKKTKYCSMLIQFTGPTN